VEQIKLIINSYGPQLSIEERNVLSIAYKNITNALRNNWRIVDSLEKSQMARASRTKEQELSLIRRQRERIEGELTEVCKDIVFLLDRYLLPAAKQGEDLTFYSKMYAFYIVHMDKGLETDYL
jgi:14-3-3 protein epsilon